jgi:hypothetical protein
MGGTLGPDRILLDMGEAGGPWELLSTLSGGEAQVPLLRHIYIYIYTHSD